MGRLHKKHSLVGRALPLLSVRFSTLRSRSDLISTGSTSTMSE